jgi:ABC-type uncharacterized transport system permease subunit
MNDPFGQITQPVQTARFGGDPGAAFGNILQLVFNVLIMAGGVWALLNFILAGYAFLAAGDNPKGVESAWAKIYQTIIGLVFLVGAFLIAGVIGLLVYGRADALLKPSLTF